MTYQGSFNELIYLQIDRSPAFTRYRFACFDDGTDMRAVIHLARFTNPALSPQEIDMALDAALNWTIDVLFTGVSIDHVHLVVKANDGVIG